MKKHVASVHVGKKPLWNNFILLCTLYDQILIYIYMFIYFGFQLLWILNIYANSEIISFYWIILKSNMNIEQKHFISSWRKKGTRAFLLDMNWLSMLNQYMKKRMSKKPGQILVVIHYCDFFRFFWLRRYILWSTKSLVDSKENNVLIYIYIIC